jgi:hypothetical protein
MPNAHLVAVIFHTKILVARNPLILVAREALTLIDYGFHSIWFLFFCEFELPPKLHPFTKGRKL